MPSAHTQQNLTQVHLPLVNWKGPLQSCVLFVFAKEQSNLCSIEQLLLDDREQKMVTIVNL